ncbi:HET domain containing protein [Hyaloscypha variabilis]
MEKRAISLHKGRLERAKVPRISAKKQPKCDICAKIVKPFRTPIRPSKEEWAIWTWVELGSFKDVMVSTTCKIHPRMLRSVFGDALNTAGVARFEARRTSDHIVIQGDCSANVASLYSWSLMCLHIPSAIPNAVSSCILRNAIAVDRQWVDSNLLRRWKRSCDKQDHEACRQWPQTSGLSSTVCPNWFIDTWRMCLIRGSTGVPYVALSYVWGQEPFFKTTRQNITQLQLDGALNNSHQSLGVPRTIADAISVVGLLEERYLWVDALCIVQDDCITRHSEINKMASIFAGASITIIAAQGEDANYGLRGLRSISQPRDRCQDIFALAKGYNIVHTRKRSKTPCLWADRGWTYQESLFARRCLYFSDDGIDWDCRCSSFHEDARANPGSKILQRDMTRDMFSTSFPSLAGYHQLLGSYNLRDFTHPQDALSAFAGITTSLSRTFYGGFVCGLPLMFLDIALCWQPSRNVCERRLPSEDKEPTELGLPSWSWVGWKCILDFWAWGYANDYVKKSQSLSECFSSQETLPIVSWFSRKWGTTETTPISLFQGVVQRLKTSAIEGKEPPKGWKRFDLSISSENWSAMDSSYGKNFARSHYFYRHERDPKSEFWYPVPSWYDTQGELPMPEIATNTLLCARTRRAWLWLKGMLKVYDMVISIRDRLGTWIGALRLQTRLPIKTSDDSRDSEAMIACELVAISAGYAIEGARAYALDEWDFKERPKASKGEKYEFYNVLWVEWKDGIAYRKALGRVMKSAWEAQDLEWIDLVLG